MCGAAVLAAAAGLRADDAVVGTGKDTARRVPLITREAGAAWSAPAAFGVRRAWQVFLADGLLEGAEQRAPLRVNVTGIERSPFEIDLNERRETRRGTIVWSGPVSGTAGGEARFVIRGGVVSGVIRAGTRGVFELRYAGGGRYALREMDINLLGTCGGALNWPAGMGARLAARGAAASGILCDDGSVIDLMVAYTTSARMAAGGVAAIEGLIELAVEDANAAYARSGVNTSLNIVHTVEVNYAETGQWMVDGPRLVGTADGFLDEVHSLRDQYGADCVSLWVQTLDAGGIGYFPDGSLTGVGASGFSMLRLDNAPLGTLAHELGHNLYCAHNRPNAPNAPWAEYAYGYVEPGGAWQTIMSVSATAYIPYFANPNVQWAGPAPPNPGPTGIPQGQPNPCDVARAFNETRTYVANFRTSVTMGLPSVLHVRSDAPGGGDGTGWPTALADLQDALCDADGSAGAVTQIWVKSGTYLPDRGTGDRSATFQLRDGIAVYGGFSGHETTLTQRNVAANPTILSGDLGTSGVASDNCYHVVTATANNGSARLDGFTISGGNANGIDPDDGGGGILVRGGGTPHIANCTISGNSAARFGGGMFNSQGSQPTLAQCDVIGNAVSGATWPEGGGGMANQDGSSPVLIGCRFSGNSAKLGGAIANLFSSSPTLSYCVIENHTGPAGAEGGGIYGYSGCSPVLTHCTLRDNSADFGGGMVNWFSCSAKLTGCIVQGNSAAIDGGGLFNYGDSDVELINCLLSGNSTNGSGGGSASLFGSDASMVNCTLVGNEAASSGGGLSFFDCAPTLANSVLWGNTIGGVTSENAQVASVSSTSTLAHCIVHHWSGALGGIGNHGLDPLLRDANGADNAYGTSDDDARLLAGSPALNTGHNAGIPGGVVTDLDGRPRVVGGTVDRGAYEYPPADAGDFDGDGDSDLADYARFVDCHAGPAASPAPIETIPQTCQMVFDFDLDGDVDLDDAGEMLRLID